MPMIAQKAVNARLFQCKHSTSYLCNSDSINCFISVDCCKTVTADCSDHQTIEHPNTESLFPPTTNRLRKWYNAESLF
jgi:hypothetical protein